MLVALQIKQFHQLDLQPLLQLVLRLLPLKADELWVGGMDAVNINTFGVTTNSFNKVAQTGSTGTASTDENFKDSLKKL